MFLGKCPLAGNSIYMDRIFIRKYMPKLESHLSYRIIDVSSLKEIFKYGSNLIKMVNTGALLIKLQEKNSTLLITGANSPTILEGEYLQGRTIKSILLCINMNINRISGFTNIWFFNFTLCLLTTFLLERLLQSKI